jgi:hypothetical protein
MIKRKYPTLDEMIQSERREASIALRHLAGESIDSEPLWMRSANGKPILTYAGALNLAELFGIERIKTTLKPAAQRNGLPVTFATVTVRLKRNTRIGAAVSRHPQVACELAFRNGVKQIVIGISDKPPTNNKLSAVRIRRIDRTPRGERRWRDAVKASNLIASLVPNREDVDWDVQQEDMGWAEELAIETLREGF